MPDLDALLATADAAEDAYLALCEGPGYELNAVLDAYAAAQDASAAYVAACTAALGTV